MPSHRASTRRALLATYRGGATAREAAAAHGVSYSTAREWIADAGIMRSRAAAARLHVARRGGPNWDARPSRAEVRATLDRALALVKRGLPCVAAAELTGCEVGSLRNRAYRAGVPTPRHHAARAADARALAWGRAWHRLKNEERAGGPRATYAAAAEAAGLNVGKASHYARRYHALLSAPESSYLRAA